MVILIFAVVGLIILNKWKERLGRRVVIHFRKMHYKANVEIMNGKQIAEAILQLEEVKGISVCEPKANNSYYSPYEKKIFIQKGLYEGTSFTSLMVASHEAMHAIQHTQRNPFMKVRVAFGKIILASQLLLIITFLLSFFFFSKQIVGFTLIGYLGLKFFLALNSLWIEIDAWRKMREFFDKYGLFGEEDVKKECKLFKKVALRTYYVEPIHYLLWMIGIAQMMQLIYGTYV